MSWTCATCGSTNDESSGRCGTCGYDRSPSPADDPSPAVATPLAAGGDAAPPAYTAWAPSGPGPISDPSGYAAPGYAAPGYPASWYGAPGYPAPSYPAPGYFGVPPGPPGTASKINGLAVASWVLAMLGWVTCGIGYVVGLVFGLVGRRQVKRSYGRELGGGLALWGAILNGLFVVAGIATIVAVVLTTRSPWQGRSTKRFDSASTITSVLECPGTAAAPSLGRIGGVHATSTALCHADGEDLVVLVYAHRNDLDRAFEGSVAFDPQALGADCTVAGDNWVVMADTNANDPGRGKQPNSLSRFAAHGLQAQLGGSVACRDDTH